MFNYWKMAIHFLFGTKRFGVNNKWREDFDSIFNIPFFGFGFKILLTPWKWLPAYKIIKLRMSIAGMDKIEVNEHELKIRRQEVYSCQTPDLKTYLGRLELKNPIILSSGTSGYGEEYSEIIDLNKIGGIVVKGISINPRTGNRFPRLCETPSGILNSIGLQNVGIDSFINEKLPFLRRFDTKIIINILGESIEEYLEIIDRLNKVDGVDSIELNISCPNVKKGGLQFGKDKNAAFELISNVRKNTSLFLITKLSPNVSDIVEFAQVAKEAGSDAVSLVNTFVGMSIDVDTRRPMLSNITGGLSGPSIRPIAVRMVWEISSKVDIPIIGMGGIMSARDAIEFILAGASCVGIGTSNFINPMISTDIIDGIEKYMRRNNISDLKKIIGGVSICH